MRDEDLKNLPQSIERWRFAELMHSLGFGPGFQNNLRELSVDYTGVHAVIYATDESGHKYMPHSLEAIEVTDLGEKDPAYVTGSSGREAAVHEISIPFVGSWEIPVNAEQHGETECTAKLIGSSGYILCERLGGHEGEHGANVDGVTHRW